MTFQPQNFTKLCFWPKLPKITYWPLKLPKIVQRSFRSPQNNIYIYIYIYIITKNCQFKVSVTMCHYPKLSRWNIGNLFSSSYPSKAIKSYRNNKLNFFNVFLQIPRRSQHGLSKLRNFYVGMELPRGWGGIPPSSLWKKNL